MNWFSAVPDGMNQSQNIIIRRPPVDFQPKTQNEILNMKTIDNYEKKRTIELDDETSDFIPNETELIIPTQSSLTNDQNLFYSIKYLGVTEGQIGILSKRLPIPRKKDVLEQELFQSSPSFSFQKEDYVVNKYSKPQLLIPIKKKKTDLEQERQRKFLHSLNDKFSVHQNRYEIYKNRIYEPPKIRKGVLG